MAKLNNNCTSDSVSLANCGDRDWSRQGFSDFVVALRCRWVLCWLLLLLLQDDVAVVVVVDKCILQSHTHSLTHSLSPSGSVPFCTGLLSCTHGHPTKIIIITNPSSMELLLLHMRHGHYNYATTASYVLSLCRSHHISRFSGC